MPLVSKRILKKKIADRMYKTFWQSLTKIKTSKESQLFLNDLLSSIEITMLAKRLAIAALLSRSYSYDSIEETLKVSRETIATVSLNLNNNNGYKIILNKLSRSEATREFWQDIEKLVYSIQSPQKFMASKETLNKKLGHGRKTLA